MKKFSIIVLVCSLVFSFAFAETDVHSLSDEELFALKDSVIAEISERLLHQKEENIIFENDSFLLYATGNGSDFSTGYDMKVVFMNKSEFKLGIMFDYVIINGWQFNIYNMLQPIKSGTKGQLEVTIDYKTAELEKKEDIKEIELGFHTFTEDYERTMFDNIPFVLSW